MQLQLNTDLKIDELEFNRAEQETYILKIQQVFDIKDKPGSRLLGLFELGVQFPGKISSVPLDGSLTESLHFPGAGCGWGLTCSADLPAGEIFPFWMKSSCSHAVRSHPGSTGADVSSNRGQKTSQAQLSGSVLQFQLWSYNLTTLQFPVLLPTLNNRFRCWGRTSIF